MSLNVFMAGVAVVALFSTGLVACSSDDDKEAANTATAATNAEECNPAAAAKFDEASSCFGAVERLSEVCVGASQSKGSIYRCAVSPSGEAYQVILRNGALVTATSGWKVDAPGSSSPFTSDDVALCRKMLDVEKQPLGCPACPGSGTACYE